MTRPTKRAKTGDHEASAETANEPSSAKNPLSILRPDLLSDESVASLKAAFSGSLPYEHVVLTSPFDPNVLESVRQEIINNVQATYKETDLFKMFQTGDLANLDALPADQAAKLKTARLLRDALYSVEFRFFISKILGCGPLTDKTDCACNVHTEGGHLLCHDDVIGTRRVSYIIYLTDPEEGWTKEDGGALELYPSSEANPHEPATRPTATLLPLWNTMAMFPVLPGKSFHSIQEVYTDEKPRMSIQGWFHGETGPEGVESATRMQLQARGDEQKGENFNGPRAEETEGELDEADKEYLGKFVNKTYLDPVSIGQIAAKFEADGSVQLHKFLEPSLHAQISSLCLEADESDKLGKNRYPVYDAGVGGGWLDIGPPHKQRYLRYNAPSTEDSSETHAAKAGKLLDNLRTELFSSAPFARLLAKLTGTPLVSQTTETRRFRPGLDYTVAHYGILTTSPRLDAVLCFADAETEEAQELWESGDVGGFEAYLPATDEGEATEYDRKVDDDGEDLLNVEAGMGVLSLVKRGVGVMRFTRYVAGGAPGSRWDVGGVYVPKGEGEEVVGEENGDK